MKVSTQIRGTLQAVQTFFRPLTQPYPPFGPAGHALGTFLSPGKSTQCYAAGLTARRRLPSRCAAGVQAHGSCRRWGGTLPSGSGWALGWGLKTKVKQGKGGAVLWLRVQDRDILEGPPLPLPQVPSPKRASAGDPGLPPCGQALPRR